MRTGSALLQNGTFRRKRSSRGKKVEFNLTAAAFAALALFLAFASMREPFMVSRVVLFVLAVISAAAPFIFFAVAAARQKREAISNAISRERRHDQTRVEIRRTVKAKAGLLHEHRTANDDPDAWSKAVERFAEEHVFPAISHAVPRSERDMWVMEIRVMVDALEHTPAARAQEPASPTPRALAFTKDCVDLIAAAGWTVEADATRLRARLGATQVIFECVVTESTVDTDAVEAFRRRLGVEAVERGAIISAQTFTPAALQAARTNGLGLIKPLHVAAFLEWAARGSSEPARAAN